MADARRTTQGTTKAKVADASVRKAVVASARGLVTAAHATAVLAHKIDDELACMLRAIEGLAKVAAARAEILSSEARSAGKEKSSVASGQDMQVDSGGQPLAPGASRSARCRRGRKARASASSAEKGTVPASREELAQVLPRSGSAPARSLTLQPARERSPRRQDGTVASGPAPAESSAVQYEIGQNVVIRDLTAKAYLNGAIGSVLLWDAKAERWAVSVKGDRGLVKGINLQPSIFSPAVDGVSR